MASILGNFIAGFLCSIPVDRGWPLIFYFFGVSSTVWVVLWTVLSSRRPEEHPFISESELQHITSHRSAMDHETKDDSDKLPFKQIMCSVPLLCFLVAGCSHVLVVIVTYFNIPIFLNKTQGFTVEQTGILVAFIALVRFLGNFFWAAFGN